jgi:repressor LexA
MGGDFIMLKLYQNIKELRKQNHWSQEELAKRMGYTDRSSIAKIEGGKVDLSQSKILEFARVFGVDAGELMGDDGIVTPEEMKRAAKLRELYKQIDSETLEAVENDPQLREFIDLFMNTSPENRPAVLQILKGLQHKP